VTSAAALQLVLEESRNFSLQKVTDRDQRNRVYLMTAVLPTPQAALAGFLP
jgi:hypothetical protein